MSLILLTWELGANLGHVVRLRSLAKRLQELGYSVVAAVRDIPTAASVLGPCEIPFIQGPRPTTSLISSISIESYQDILLAQGWRDPAVLWSYVAAWITLYRTLKPAMVVHDASPCARLASWICDLPALYVGNGYDIPPNRCPLPPFPGTIEVDRSRFSSLEDEALDNANAVTAFFKARPLNNLRDLFSGVSMLVTFPELDHYGARIDENYVGTLYSSEGKTISSSWPPKKARHVFAYLRPTPQIADVLGGLVESGLHATCFLPGFEEKLLRNFEHSRIQLHTRPISFDCLYDRTSVCLSYAAEGTVASFLLRGIPQVLVPTNVEGELTAERVRHMGAGLVVKGKYSARLVREALVQVINGKDFEESARTFADKHPDYDPAQATDLVVKRIINMLNS